MRSNKSRKNGMSKLKQAAIAVTGLAAFAAAGLLAQQNGAGGLWHGFRSQIAAARPGAKRDYDLTRLEAVNATLKHIKNRYVDPDRVKPRDMLLNALNAIQSEVAQVIVLPDSEVKGQLSVRVDTHEKKIRVDNVAGPWDVAAKLREVFTFLQRHLSKGDVKLREVEYAACNGLLRTLDPHSTFLNPEAYKEMNLSTSGAFGGLGIVISIRDQLLTIIRPMPETPAGKAGLKRYDRVMKINDESTLNMPLDDAVRRLRGEPGSKVNIWVARPNEWQGEKRFELTRQRIRVRSVLYRTLQPGIGYLRLKQFQPSSTDEMREALNAMSSKQPLKGLVFDLRGNPGGLLNQAASVSNLFLKRGVLVATVGAVEGREEKRATARGTEPDYPIVVLVNGSSASASEIVAGALKNLNRAVIVGEPTFGKGSVQLVFPNVTPDRAALKLTIAQYLTPGDNSIQGVGVRPHVELDPMTIDNLEMDLTLKRNVVRERDLSQHLSNTRAKRPKTPSQVVRYYFPQEKRQNLRVMGGELDDVFAMDFPISFGRDLVAQLKPRIGARESLAKSSSFIRSARKKEVEKVGRKLNTLDVDWSLPNDASQSPGKDEFVVTATTDRPNDTVTAGQAINLKVSVTNNGKTAVHRLHATTQSDNPYFNEHELVFGKIGAGETKIATTPLAWCSIKGRKAGTTAPLPANYKRECIIPRHASNRADGVKIHFNAHGGNTPASAEVRPTIRPLPRPMFQYSYQVSDNIKGNGDGLVQRGERITVYLTVKNVGVGSSHETQANLSNRSGGGVLLRQGRFDISNMKPGSVRKVAFTLDVRKQLSEKEVVLGLVVGDRDVREYAREKIRIPIMDAIKVEPASGVVMTLSAAQLYPDAKMHGEWFGSIPANTPLRRMGRYGVVSKVALGANRFAFVLNTKLKDGTKAKDNVGFSSRYSHAPPTLKVTAEALSTRKSSIKLHVEASDHERLLDMYIFVGPRKLYYRSNRSGSDPKKASFDFDAPLKPGVNIISVIARESADTATRRTLIVRRDDANGAILKTPKDQSNYLIEALK